MSSLALHVEQSSFTPKGEGRWDYPDRRPLVSRGVIRRTYRLPAGDRTEILVRVGQTVECGAVVARYALAGRATAVDSLTPLGLVHGREDLMLRSLVRRAGEEVIEGDELARRNIMGGLQRRDVRAPVAGRLIYVSSDTGTLFIAPDPVQRHVRTHLGGTVVDVSGDAITIEGNVLAVAACAGAGDAATGGLMLVESQERLPPDARGAVVVCAFTVNEPTVRAMIDAGAAALVASAIDESALQRLGWDDLFWPAGPRTSRPSPPLTVVLLTLTGAPAPVFEALRPYAGRLASAVGGAPGLAPELVVGLGERAPSRQPTAEPPGGGEVASLRPGAQVRVLSGQAEGLTGEVVAISQSPYRLPSEVSTPVADVVFPFDVRLRLPVFHLQILSPNG
jgi:hypothetical protein